MNHEKNKHNQTGAALCIASVIRNTVEQEVTLHLTKLVQRIQKQLNSPSCLAKAAIFVVISSLVEVEIQLYRTEK